MELGVRLLGAVELLASFLLWPFYLLLRFLGPPPSPPPITSAIITQPATRIANSIRHRHIKCRDVVSAYIERIKEVNPYLNAVVEERFEEAMKEAEAVDTFLATTSKPPEQIKKETPFLGVPFTVKESCGLQGMSQCVGCKPRMGVRAAVDGGSVRRVKAAGAIPLAVTNTPELCLCWESNNLVTGITFNPYNRHRTAGGSSGGEGALLGSGASVIGIGSDIAGSIRIPAMFNGVFGHKPTPGYVPLEGHYPLSADPDFKNFLVVGPMARYAEDLTPLLRVMAGPSAVDLNLDKEVDLGKLNVYYKEDAGFSLVCVPVEKEIKGKIREAADYLKERGASVSKAELSEMSDSVEISAAVFLGMEGIPDLLQLSSKGSDEPKNLYKEFLRSLAGKSEFSIAGLLFMLILKLNLFIPRSKYNRYKQENRLLKEKITGMLGDNGVFLYPTFPVPAVHHNEIFNKTAGVMYTMIFNTLELPATHVPMGLNKEGLPIGIQVVGGPHQDRLCLAVAKALQDKFGGWCLPPASTQ